MCTPEDDARTRTFIDLSALQDAQLTFLDALGFAERLRDRRAMRAAAPVRVAVYAPGQLPFGVARMCQQVADGLPDMEIMVSQNQQEALAFVGLTAPPVQSSG